MIRHAAKIAVPLAVLGIVLSFPGSGRSTPPPPYRDEVLADNPISYWRLGETSGAVAADERGINPGNYANGVILGVPGTIWNDGDRAASFDGLDDQVAVPHSSSLSLTSGVTEEAWVKRTRSGSSSRSSGSPSTGSRSSRTTPSG